MIAPREYIIQSMVPTIYSENQLPDEMSRWFQCGIPRTTEHKRYTHAHTLVQMRTQAPPVTPIPLKLQSVGNQSS